MLPLQEAQVRSQVEEPRSGLPCGAAKKKEKSRMELLNWQFMQNGLNKGKRN